MHGDVGGAHGVDTVLGRPCGVGGPALKAVELGDESVAGAVCHQVFLLAAGVVSHHDVHVVQGADAQQFALSAAVADQALAAHFVALFNFYVFLRRDAEKHHVAVESGGDLRIRQRQGRAHDASHLGVVAAAMGGAGLRIGVSMVGNGKAVQLSHQADGGAVAAVFQIALHSGDGQALLGPQAKAFHNNGKLSGGAVLLKSQFRMGPKVLGKGDDLVFAGIHQRTDFLFHFVHHKSGLPSAACGRGFIFCAGKPARNTAPPIRSAKARGPSP